MLWSPFGREVGKTCHLSISSNQNSRQKNPRKPRPALGNVDDISIYDFWTAGAIPTTITFMKLLFLIGSQIRDVEIANSHALQIEATIMSILKLS